MDHETLSRGRRQAADPSGRQTAVWFLLLGFACAIPIILHPLPPLLDYANHLARMHVLATIGKDQYLSQFYEVEWQIIPNLIMDAIVPLLQPIIGVYHAGQLFNICSIVLIISGALYLNRALYGQWSAAPLLVAPLSYNRIFLLGFMNYTFGLGLALWGLAAWIFLRERAWPGRILVSSLFCLALFFCHLFDVGVYGLGVLSVEIWRLWARRERPLSARMVDFVVAGLPFVSVAALLVMSPTWGLAGENLWEAKTKLDGLYAVVVAYSTWVALGLLVVVSAAAVWAVRRRALRIHPVGWIVLGLGGVIYLAMPSVFFSTFLADQRLPIALAFIVIGCAHLELRRRTERVAMLALVACLVIIRVVEVDAYWRDWSRETLALRDSIGRIDQRGARILVAESNEMDEYAVQDFGLPHAACLAVIERSALVSTLFTIPGKQIVRARPAYRGQVETGEGDVPELERLESALKPFSPTAVEPTAPDWQLWQNHFDYLYVVFTEKDAPNPMPELLTAVYQGEHFQLYKIAKPGDAGNKADRSSAHGMP
jgi:hypothetical protein